MPAKTGACPYGSQHKNRQAEPWGAVHDTPVYHLTPTGSCRKKVSPDPNEFSTGPCPPGACPQWPKAKVQSSQVLKGAASQAGSAIWDNKMSDQMHTGGKTAPIHANLERSSCRRQQASPEQRAGVAQREKEEKRCQRDDVARTVCRGLDGGAGHNRAAERPEQMHNRGVGTAELTRARARSTRAGPLRSAPRSGERGR